MGVDEQGVHLIFMHGSLIWEVVDQFFRLYMSIAHAMSTFEEPFGHIFIARSSNLLYIGYIYRLSRVVDSIV